MNRWETEQKIVIRALKDPAFKKQLLAQPKEALRELFKNEKVVGFTAWEKINIRVVEEQKEEWVLSIPYVDERLASLSEEQMEKMSGGAVGGVSVLLHCDG